MNSKFQILNSKFRNLSAKLFLLFTFYFLLFTSACSIPNLENPECAKARQTIKEFYSYHFGSDMKLSKENLQRREKFLTEDLKSNLAAQIDDAKDYFTATNDYPKAFRVGSCEVAGENKIIFQIVLFWRDDTRNEQREVKVESVKQNDKWLINKVTN